MAEKNTIRLDKYLADMGVGTRKEVGRMIRNQAVSVNDVVVRDSAYKVDINADKIIVAGNELGYQSFYYYMLNKPAGCITSTEKGPTPTVMDVLRTAGLECPRFDELSPVGRLDIDTEGLLLITNDGALNHDLLSPAKHVKKTYYVETSEKIKDSDIKKFNDGMDLGDFVAKPADLTIIDDTHALVTISEGKFHQIKRMFNKCENEVVYLKRISMACLKLDESLETGDFRELTDEEIKALKEENNK
ncbi:MAG: pseudouridine synthase [Catonella sp.]|nr:pseudouridine synthase [Catonella sp.]MDY6356887.1 pseudouridine synthase [Catonella sp.]